MTMIFVTDKGRMCNNILQYGHVYAWARAHGRRSISMRFSHKYQYFKICHLPWHNFFVYLVAKYAAKWKLIPTIDFSDAREEIMQQNANLLLQSKNVLVTGWCVPFHDYFVKYKHEILNLFAFEKHIVAKTEAFMGRKDNDEIRLGVHVRRGDYKTWHGGKYYFDDDVYVGYVKQFQTIMPDKKLTVYVCSNDPKVDKSVYNTTLPNAKIIFPSGGQEDDLCLLSKCDYLIGAPSTFSLVAAMYKDTPLYWIENKDGKLTHESFDKFDNMFRSIR